MNKLSFFIGIIIGVLVALLGSFLYLEFVTGLGFKTAFEHTKATRNMGKVISLGALLNLFVVLFLFKKNKDTMAKGVIFSLFVLTIYSLFS
ncbi:MAG TPA: hypothetical protein DDZ41_00305 [Flavobacterium sp.]|nr:hypothetical protein [Flavobacterium sp.]